MVTIQEVTHYQFRVSDLNLSSRTQGISAFMRVKNGADFLRATVESHIDFFDEIVIVFNQCQDDTETIIKQLLIDYPHKIKAFHYLAEVAALGVVDPTIDNMANYSNFALAQTQYTILVKLDDDHIAMPSRLQSIVNNIRQNNYSLNGQMWCFSGLNIFKQNGEFGVLKHEPFSGSGDIGFFAINANSVFYQTPKFEVFNRNSFKRVYQGIAYLHLKYLKKGNGFNNYALDKNPNSRFARKKQMFDQTAQMESFADFLKHYAYLKPCVAMAKILPDKFGIQILRCATLEREIGADAATVKQVLRTWLG